MQEKQKLFTGFYCSFCIHKSSILSLKIQNLKLPQSAAPQSEPFAFQAQLADYCHFTFSLFFYAFYLRAREEWCEERLLSCYYYYFSRTIFSFVLIQKKQKIKPENRKLENYLKVPFRISSR
jgi:hypothetical protein